MTQKLKESIERFRKDGTPENLSEILRHIDRLHSHGMKFLTPININGENKEGGPAPEDIELVRISDGKSAYLTAFTSLEELQKGPETAALHMDIETMMDEVIGNVSLAGIVIDPWSSSFMFKDDLVRIVKEMMDSKRLRAHDVSEDFFIFSPEQKPVDLFINIRQLMPGFPAVKKVYYTGLNNGGIERHLLMLEFEGEEMGELFGKILEVLPAPADGKKVEITPFTQEVPVADLVYERLP